MKNQIILLLIILSTPHAILMGCPTCIGRNQTQSPPFFTQEFYPPEKDGLDELYEQFIEPPKTVSTRTAPTTDTPSTSAQNNSPSYPKEKP